MLLKLFLFLSFATIFLNAGQIEEVANSKEWKVLLHVDENNISQIQDKNFYLSEQSNPVIELRTLLDNMNCQNICKFPARYNFISKKFNRNISFSHCSTLNTFLIDTESDDSSIVFAAPYLESPVSYFGHTFIKLNKQDDLFFSETISYSAKIPENIPIWKLAQDGIMGGFQGKYVVSPYFKLYEGYNAIEQRNLYEYKLTLEKDELYKMRLHVYELLDINVPYEFFNKNCSSELFWLLDNARPGLNLHEKLNAYTIPFDTIEILKSNQLIVSSQVYPSLNSRLHKIYNQLSDEEKNIFLDLKQHDVDKKTQIDKLDISLVSKNKIIELLNGYHDLMFKKFNTYQSDFREVKNLRFTESDIYLDSEYHQSKPHGIEFGILNDNQRIYQTFEFKPIFFDRYESYTNNINESTLQFFNFELIHDDNWMLNRLNLLKIESHTKQKPFYAPLSWRVVVGMDRNINKNISPLIEFGVGPTYGNDNFALFFIGQASTYPLDNTFGLQGVYGLSVWMTNNIHLNVDFKNTFIHAGNDINDEKAANLLFKYSISSNIKLKKYLGSDSWQLAIEKKF